MIQMDVTEDERSVILKMREWTDGIPESALGHGRDSAVYISLVAARAELYKIAIRHMHNDLGHRREALLALISPWLMLSLCRAWQWKRQREADDEEAEMVASAE